MFKDSLKLIMGSDEEQPKKRWGIRHSLAAGTVLTVGQLWAVQNYVFTRAEAEPQIQRINVIEKDSKELRRDLYKELQDLNGKISELTGYLKEFHETYRKR